MRIAVVIHEYPPIGGGAATNAAKVAECLTRSGHEVLVVTSAVSGVPRDETVAGVNIQRLPSLRTRRFAPQPYELLTFCGSAWWLLTSRLRRFRPDLIIAFMAIPAGYFAVRAARRLGVPSIVSLQGSDVPGFSRKRLGGIYRKGALPLIRRTLLDADRIAPNSQVLYDLTTQFLPKIAGKMEVIRNGIEPDCVAKHTAHSDANTFRLIQVGQLIARKRVDATVEAVAVLHGEGAKVSLTVIGEGPEDTSLRKLVSNRGLTGCVNFRGYLAREEILTELRSHDLFVMPSRAEGMSNALLEAMASGLPVIIARNGSHDIVEESSCGDVLDDLSPQSFAASVKRFLNNSEFCNECAESALEFARRHSWERCTQRFLELINDVTSKNRTHR